MSMPEVPDRAQRAAAVGGLLLLRPQDASEEVIELYLQTLRDLPTWAFVQAIEDAIGKHTFASLVPPGTIRREAQRLIGERRRMLESRERAHRGDAAVRAFRDSWSVEGFAARRAELDAQLERGELAPGFHDLLRGILDRTEAAWRDAGTALPPGE